MDKIVLFNVDKVVRLEVDKVVLFNADKAVLFNADMWIKMSRHRGDPSCGARGTGLLIIPFSKCSLSLLQTIGCLGNFAKTKHSLKIINNYIGV